MVSSTSNPPAHANPAHSPLPCLALSLPHAGGYVLRVRSCKCSERDVGGRDAFALDHHVGHRSARGRDAAGACDTLCTFPDADAVLILPASCLRHRRDGSWAPCWSCELVQLTGNDEYIGRFEQHQGVASCELASASCSGLLTSCITGHDWSEDIGRVVRDSLSDVRLLGRPVAGCHPAAIACFKCGSVG